MKITTRAAQAYAELLGIAVEDARTELARLIPLARSRKPNRSGAESWRWRGRPQPDDDAVDLTATVVDGPSGYEVTALSARWRAGRGDRRRH